MAVQPTDRRRARHEATKAEIVRAAWDLAAERGLGGWTLRDVAEAVGMRAPSLYVYFDSKNGLYDAMYADGYRSLIERFAMIDETADPVDVLRRGVHALFEFGVEQPARIYLMFLRTIPGFEPSPESYAVAQEVYARSVRVLDAAGATGPGAMDVYTALVSGLVTQQVSNDPGGDRWGRVLDDALDMYLAAYADKSSGRGARRAPRRVTAG